METELMFEYPCPECGHGTVRTTRVHNYKTKIKGYPFVVDEALIGVCDQCHAESFAPEETKRWETLFSRSLEASQAFLSPEEITELRKALDLSMEDFARLIGSTRQSISMWEKEERVSPPLRTADLLMKLVRQSHQAGPVDVLTFLLNEARKWGVIIELRRSLLHSNEDGITVFHTKRNSLNTYDQKKDLLARLDIAQEKYARLQHFPVVIARDFWKKIKEIIEAEAGKPQPPKLPVLFFLLDRREIQSLSGIDRLLGCLNKSRNKRHRKELGNLIRRLQMGTTDYRNAAGAVFEAEILATLLKGSNGESVTLYPQIRNNGFPEAAINLGQKTVYLEATLLSQTEDQERIWEIGTENLYEQKKPSQAEIQKLGISKVNNHSSFSIVSGVGDPYNDALRLVRKIDEKRKQLAPDAPNVICLGLSDLDPHVRSLKWGAEDIFSGTLESAQAIKRRLETRLSNDRTLRVDEVQNIKEEIQRLERWINKFTAEPRLTGILVFQWEGAEFVPKTSFHNPSPSPESSLLDVEWKTLLHMLGFC